MSCNLNNNKFGLESCNGDFQAFDKMIKDKFFKDIVENKIYRKGKKISAGSSPAEIEKCYEHITSVGCIDSETRLPDLRRYECISILKDMLTSDMCNNCEKYYVWEKEEKILKEMIFCPETGYLIILHKRDYVYKIVSAYYISRIGKRQKLIEECKKFNEKKEKGSP